MRPAMEAWLHGGEMDEVVKALPARFGKNEEAG